MKLTSTSFNTVELQVIRYVSDRTGIISFANFPMIWLFGMRNNLLMWLTGWDFGTYNNFHRWVARIATLQAIVHSVGYTVLVIKGMLRSLCKRISTLTNLRGWLVQLCILVELHVLVDRRDCE